MREQNRADLPNWTTLGLTLVISFTSVSVWAYSTFVTIRERDMLRGSYEQRVAGIETKQDEQMKALSRIEGKLDRALKE